MTTCTEPRSDSGASTLRFKHGPHACEADVFTTVPSAPNVTLQTLVFILLDEWLLEILAYAKTNGSRPKVRCSPSDDVSDRFS